MDVNGIQVALRNEEVWKRMAPNAEMMLTKAGRRLIPGLEVEINGLCPEALYCFKIKFERLGEFKLKYVDGQWLPGSNAEELAIREYEQPDGWQTGRNWMESGVSFSELKITNDPDNTDPAFIVLRTFYEYCPVITMTKMEENSEPTSAFIRVELAMFYTVTEHKNRLMVEIKAAVNKVANKRRKRARNEVASVSNGNRPKRPAPGTSSRNIMEAPALPLTPHCQQPELQQQLEQFMEPHQEQQQFGTYLEHNQKLQLQHCLAPPAMHRQQHQHSEQQQQVPHQNPGFQRQTTHPMDPLHVGHAQEAFPAPQLRQYLDAQGMLQPQQHRQPEQYQLLQKQYLEVQQHPVYPVDPWQVGHVQQNLEQPIPPQQLHQPHQLNQQVKQQCPVQDQQTAEPIDPWLVAPYAEVPQESSSGGRVFRTPTMEELKQLCPSIYYRS